MDQAIANRLLELRREHGYSQEELAVRLGVSRQAVSKWERAESSPDTDNLVALARLYGISLDDLLLLHTEAQGGTAAQAAPAPEEAEQDEEQEVFAAAREWDRAELSWKEEKRKRFEKVKEKLLLLLTLALMVILPLVCNLLHLGEIYAVVVVIAYVVLGFLLDNWHPGWLLFLSIPLYYYILSGAYRLYANFF